LDIFRRLITQPAQVTLVVVVFVVALLVTALPSGAQKPPTPPSLEGVWTLNNGADSARTSDTSGTGRRGDASGRSGGRGGARRAGFGGGGSLGTAGLGIPYGTGDRADRLREAMNDLTAAPSRLTIVQTDTTVIVTTGEGHTTRLAPNGKKIKDENTGIERSTKWTADALVSDITGLGSGKITQSFSVNPDDHRLLVTITFPPRLGGTEPTIVTRFYDRDER
jgi:hypothetical protein